MNQRAKLAGRAQRLAHQQAVRRRRRWLAVGLPIAGALVLAAAVVVAATRDSGSPRTSTPRPPAAAPASVSSDGAGLALGSGPVTVELYSDFLCPGCGYFEREAIDSIESLVAGNSVTLIYRPVAILDQASTNKYSTRSAAAGACAADAGRFLPYVKVLFGVQPSEGSAGYTDEQLISLGKSAGIADPSFAQCVRDKRYVDWVGTVTDAMMAKNILRTPTVIVAGEELQSPTGERLVAAVRAAAG